MSSEPTPVHDGIDRRQSHEAVTTAVRAIMEDDLLVAFAYETGETSDIGDTVCMSRVSHCVPRHRLWGGRDISMVTTRPLSGVLRRLAAR